MGGICSTCSGKKSKLSSTTSMREDSSPPEHQVEWDPHHEPQPEEAHEPLPVQCDSVDYRKESVTSSLTIEVPSTDYRKESGTSSTIDVPSTDEAFTDTVKVPRPKQKRTTEQYCRSTENHIWKDMPSTSEHIYYSGMSCPDLHHQPDSGIDTEHRGSTAGSSTHHFGSVSATNVQIGDKTNIIVQQPPEPINYEAIVQQMQGTLRGYYCNRGAIFVPMPWVNADTEFKMKIHYLEPVVTHKNLHEVEETCGAQPIVNLLCRNSSGRRILVEGDLGYGKSTLFKKLAYDWATGEAHPELQNTYDLVFLVPLEEVGTNLSEYLCQMVETVTEVQSAEDMEKALKYVGSRLLLLLDGYDELTEDEAQRSVRKVVQCKMFPNAALVLSTRPVPAQTMLHCDFNDNIFAVRGFSEESIRMFISSYFNGENSEQRSRSAELVICGNLSPVKHLATCPMLLYQLCHLIDDELGVLPTTLTECYKELLKNNIRQGLGPLDIESKENVKRVLETLGGVCMDALQNNRLAFKESEMQPIRVMLSDAIGCPSGKLARSNEDILLRLGILSHQRTVRNRVTTIKFQVIHKSFSEFLVAQHLTAKAGSTQQFYRKVGHIVNRLSEGVYSPVMTFLAGLLRDRLGLLLEALAYSHCVVEGDRLWDLLQEAETTTNSKETLEAANRHILPSYFHMNSWEHDQGQYIATVLSAPSCQVGHVHADLQTWKAVQSIEEFPFPKNQSIHTVTIDARFSRRALHERVIQRILDKPRLEELAIICQYDEEALSICRDISRSDSLRRLALLFQTPRWKTELKALRVLEKPGLEEFTAICQHDGEALTILNDVARARSLRRLAFLFHSARWGPILGEDKLAALEVSMANSKVTSLYLYPLECCTENMASLAIIITLGVLEELHLPAVKTFRSGGGSRGRDPPGPIAVMFQALSSPSCHLRLLDLKQAGISPAACSVLADLLPRTRTLQELILGDINSTGCRSLFNVVQGATYNGSIRNLDVSTLNPGPSVWLSDVLTTLAKGSIQKLNMSGWSFHLAQRELTTPQSALVRCLRRGILPVRHLLVRGAQVTHTPTQEDEVTADNLDSKPVSDDDEEEELKKLDDDLVGFALLERQVFPGTTSIRKRVSVQEVATSLSKSAGAISKKYSNENFSGMVRSTVESLERRHRFGSDNSQDEDDVDSYSPAQIVKEIVNVFRNLEHLVLNYSDLMKLEDAAPGVVTSLPELKGLGVHRLEGNDQLNSVARLLTPIAARLEVLELEFERRDERIPQEPDGSWAILLRSCVHLNEIKLALLRAGPGGSGGAAGAGLWLSDHVDLLCTTVQNPGLKLQLRLGEVLASEIPSDSLENWANTLVKYFRGAVFQLVMDLQWWLLPKCFPAVFRHTLYKSGRFRIHSDVRLRKEMCQLVTATTISDTVP